MPFIPYPQEFFALQLAFAQKMSEISQQPYHDAVLHDTALYRILGLDWSLEPNDPVWQAYLRGLSHEGRDDEWTYQFYLSRYDAIPKYDIPRWGCFSYQYLADSRVIHMHFSNLDASGYGPLSSLRKEARVAELQAMFLHIKEKHPAAQLVKGGSWLHNREEYKRLFPPAYGQSARADKPHLIGRGLWGQFLRHNNQLNEKVATLFSERVSQLRDVKDYARCFPYQAMLVEAPIASFYEFYGIS